jgi:hypothetical protein
VFGWCQKPCWWIAYRWFVCQTAKQELWYSINSSEGRKRFRTGRHLGAAAMASFGHLAPCAFPATGANCSGHYTQEISPALDYVCLVGVAWFTLLSLPSLWRVHVAWQEFRISGETSIRSGYGLRLGCAVFLFIGGVATIVFFGTGMLLRYPVTEPLGLVSLAAEAISVISYNLSGGCFLLLMRLVFFSTLRYSRRSPTMERIRKINEAQILFIFIFPLTLTYAAGFYLATAGIVTDNIILIRILLGGCTLPIFSLIVLNRVYGHAAVEAIKKAFTTSEDSAPGSAAGVRALTDKLSGQLRVQDANCAVLVVLFLIFSVTNLLHNPVICLAHEVYNFIFVFSVSHVMQLGFLKKGSSDDDDEDEEEEEGVSLALRPGDDKDTAMAATRLSGAHDLNEPLFTEEDL